VRRAIVLAIVLAAGVASAQPGDRPPAQTPPPGWKPPVIIMDDHLIRGRLRGLQLIYFLDRASEELDRARLERRSFIPELVRTLDEEAL
jgi:hypothetical protein